MLDIGMRRQLPPLNSLIAAESAARLGSFKAASEELNVTASAISHQIRALESWLGFRLFNRSVRAIKLTEAGRRYMFEVSSLLDDLSKRTKLEIARSGKGQTLTVQTTDSFANRWLVARLPDFLSKRTGLNVQIITFEYTEGFRSPEADLAILYGRGDWPSTPSQLLLPEEIFPVGSPKLKLSYDKTPSLDAINDQTLLHDDNLGTSWQEWWDFASNGRTPNTNLLAGLHYNHSHLTLLAAELGNGLALASWPLVIDALKEHSLVALTGNRLKTGYGYYVLESPVKIAAERAKPFVDWLVNQAKIDTVNSSMHGQENS